MVTSITYEHIKQGSWWQCYQNINDGITIHRQWVHHALSYEESLNIARCTRANYNHIPEMVEVQTIHICRNAGE